MLAASFLSGNITEVFALKLDLHHAARAENME